MDGDLTPPYDLLQSTAFTSQCAAPPRQFSLMTATPHFAQSHALRDREE